MLGAWPPATQPTFQRQNRYFSIFRMLLMKIRVFITILGNASVSKNENACCGICITVSLRGGLLNVPSLAKQ